MSAITLDDVQCETKSISRWVSDLAIRPLWGMILEVCVVADKATEVALSARSCLHSCPEIEKGPRCLPETIEAGTRISTGFRRIERKVGLLRFLLGKKLSDAAEAWEILVEDAEDIRDMIEAEQDASPSIPWEQLKAEIGSCPTQ